MPHPNLYKRAEAEHGKDMVDILEPLLKEGGLKRAADVLHVDEWTAWKWARMAGLKLEKRWVRVGQQRKECAS